MYLLRLDDASEYMNIEKWDRMEKLLIQYNICPIVGVIPNNKDEKLIKKYTKDKLFWEKVKRWERKKWSIAMHGYTHQYIAKCGGINPINNKSEFAGVQLEEQKIKIREGIKLLKEKGIQPKIFFAPSHTFDDNTLLALQQESNINIISDTIANNIYWENNFFFIPQQSGKVRKLPFKIVTFCYHPNNMTDEQFEELEKFLQRNRDKFGKVEDIKWIHRKKNLLDQVLQRIYFLRKGRV